RTPFSRTWNRFCGDYRQCPGTNGPEILAPNEKETQASRPHRRYWIRAGLRLRRTDPRKAKKTMSELVVVSYPDVYRAGEVCAALQRLQQEFLIEMEDAAFVIREQDGKIKLHQTQPVVGMAAGMGATRGTIWGVLIGLLFMQPLLGMAAG